VKKPALPDLIRPEGEPSWTSDAPVGGLKPMTDSAPRLSDATMTSVEKTRGPQSRDKLTIADVCADLDISRRTFYEWRAKNKAPKCITLPNGSLRIRRSEYQRWLASREAA
jgi:predicted DNA-binding transcriptional regulator AlpA